MDHKWILLVALIGHVLCWYCDRLLICTPGGNFSFADMKDPERMDALFHDMPPKRAIQSIVLGTAAMFLQFFGYLALGLWMRQYSALWANIMIAGAALLYTSGMAHHVLGGATEWMVVRLGCSEENIQTATEFFRKTSATMVGCFLGIIVFSVAHFIPVVSGLTPLPVWACVFNLLPLYLVQAPFHVPGAGNLAGAVMYLGLFVLL